MGGTKKKTLAGMEKEQSKKPEEESKKKETKQKGRKGGSQPHLTFSLRDEEALGPLKSLKAITVYSAAKSLNVKASVASATLRGLEAKGLLKRVGGFSGHYVYSLAQG